MGAFVILGLAIGKGTGQFHGQHGGNAPGVAMGMTASQLASALGIGLIAVFWAYDGWVYITWVAGEVKSRVATCPAPWCSALSWWPSYILR